MTDQEASVYFEAEMWVAERGARKALRVLRVDRSRGAVVLETETGHELTVGALSLMSGVLLIRVAPRHEISLVTGGSAESRFPTQQSNIIDDLRKR